MSKLLYKQTCEIIPDGTKEYWFHGRCHRDPKDGPAVILSNGSRYYYVNGEEAKAPKRASLYRI
jgi:hypothetical protein